MDNEGVTDSESDSEGDSHESSSFRYMDTFRKLCPWYMSIGMSVSEFWDGDAELPRYYREAHEYKRNYRNEQLWLQGFYIYEAILDSAPVINPLSKKREPLPYRSHPIPLNEAQSEQQTKEENQRKLENGRNRVRDWMIAVNSKFKESTDGTT